MNQAQKIKYGNSLVDMNMFQLSEAYTKEVQDQKPGYFIRMTMVDIEKRVRHQRGGN